MNYVDTIIARCPPGTIRVSGNCPRPRKEAPKTMGASMSAADQPPAGVGHNSEARAIDAVIDHFDSIAAANLKRGLYRSQAECWRLASNDPRCTWRHLRVLGIVFGYINSSTAIAFPGWKAIQAETAKFSGGVPDPSGGYTHHTIRDTLSDLQQWGYLPSGGQRKGYGRLAVYTVGTPALERLAREIAVHLGLKADNAQEERERIERNVRGRVDTTIDTSGVNGGIDTSRGVNGGIDTSAGRVDGRVDGGIGQELERELEDKKTLSGADAPSAGTTPPSGNTKTEARSKPKRATPAGPPAPSAGITTAVAAYNEAADYHGFSRCTVLTEVRRKRLERRIVDIGGIEAFKLALSAIPKNDFLMGRVSGRNFGKPFKLDIDRLLQTDGGLGDVLAKLLDAASSSQSRATSDEEAELAATLARMRAEEGWS